MGSSVQLPDNLRHLAARSGGSPLPAQVLQRMESVFGTDLSGVRVHVGPEAATLGALAFTQGDNIHFAPGQYDPHSARGQRLLGHEIAHVVQQRAGRVRNPFGNAFAVVQDPHLEAEAERMASRVAQAAPSPAAARPSQASHGTAPRIVQAHPMVEVQITGVTHLRESDRGQSLVRGSDFAEVEFPERVVIDKGDVWDSHLGMNLAVSGGPVHEWYRVVKYNGRDLLDRDVYIRQGMFRETRQAQGFVQVVRFCDMNRPETLWSPDSQYKNRARREPSWRTTSTRSESILNRAYQHMDGATANSPFVSVAESEQDLLRYGHSGGLRDIMFGAQDTSVQAPHIGIFRVPVESLVTPDMIAEGIPGARAMSGWMRARMETERLYYGDDMGLYLVAWKRNPYSRIDYERMMKAQEDAERDQERIESERVAKQIEASASRPKGLFTKKVKENWERFKGIADRFKARAGHIDWSGFDTLSAATLAPAMGRILRPLDELLLALPAVRDEWYRDTSEFRV